MANDPYYNAKKLTAREAYRIRIGNYRVIYEINNNELVKDLFESLDEDEQRIFKSFNLITVKQFLIVANVGEEELANFDVENFRGKISRDKNIPIIPLPQPRSKISNFFLIFILWMDSIKEMLLS